ncbi:46480_t:CDS:2 [Gigaspora margarita]|uniref:46480_t:CDS:1 n=1 Tax=Gigaspora margarita TaxID=4874 RepID=A0ABN7UEH1_GIGMA|nr:46480_t:CDS:2 [Gigaspora margarita]
MCQKQFTNASTDMLDARHLSIWIKLLSSKALWAMSERKSIAAMILSKRKLTINEILSQNSYKIREWPNH